MKTPSKYAIALTASLGLFMAILDTTIVNVGLVPMSKAFNTDLNTMQWVLTGYLLAQAAVIPVSGYLGNRFGQRRIFMLSLGFFTFGSLLCALSSNESWLIAFRVIQGLGAGALFPLGQAIAFGAFPPEKRASAAPIVGVPILLAPAFGPTIGGLIIDNWGWEYMFYINVPVGLVTILLVWWVLPADVTTQVRAKARFDYLGLILSMLGLLAIVYAFTLVSEIKPNTQSAFNPRGELYGWGYWLVWALIGVGLLLLAIFAWYELKISKDPVIDLNLFKDYNFSTSSLVIWFAMIVLFSSLLLIPVFLQQVRVPHLSALDTGLALMPQGIAAFFGVAFGAKFFSRIGVRNLVLIGTLILLASTWPLMNLSPETDGSALLPWLLLRGISFGMIAIPVQTLATQRITGPALAKANSLFNMIRQIAQSTGNALIISLFAQQTLQHATELREQAMKALPVGTLLNPNSPQFLAMREQLATKAGTTAVNDVFTAMAYGALLMLILALALPNRKKQAEGLTAGSDSQAKLEAALMG
ncbi:MAG: multidrug efflux MFS transporter [Chloroflexi bacterium]|nr:multidrug efflux MFS transporter [Chloroflexota bacterium]